MEDLLHESYPRVYAVCRRLVGHDADAADAAQNAMIAVARGLAGFDRRSRYATWSYRIAVNASFDELRRRRRRPIGTDTTPEGVGPAADERIGRLDIDNALLQLPEEFRAAVVLRDLCGLDYAEIADVLQIPPGTVRSRIARGRAALVPLLEAEP
jgi:RNA polymerase sigma-70 factor (ECF subfamily)